MFISSNSFNALHDAFKMCNDPKTIKEAEKKLKALACYPYYPRLLIDYCVNYQSQALRAAIEFKLWAQKPVKIFNGIQEDIIQVYLQLSQPISYHICIGIIGLADHIGVNSIIDSIINNPFSQKGLYLLYKLSKKYPNEMSCQKVTNYLLSISISLASQFYEYDLQTFKSMKYLLKILQLTNTYSVEWNNIIKQILSLENTKQEIFQLKGQAISLIVQNDFDVNIVMQFSADIWDICFTQQEEKLIMNALQFFRLLIKNCQEVQKKCRDHLRQTMEVLIIANLSLNQQEFDLFQEETELFAEIFFTQDNKINSSRSQANKLLIELIELFPVEINKLLDDYLNQQIQQRNLNNDIAFINILICLSQCTMFDYHIIQSYYVQHLQHQFNCMLENTSEHQYPIPPIVITFYLRFLKYFNQFLNPLHNEKIFQICIKLIHLPEVSSYAFLVIPVLQQSNQLSLQQQFIMELAQYNNSTEVLNQQCLFCIESLIIFHPQIWIDQIVFLFTKITQKYEISLAKQLFENLVLLIQSLISQNLFSDLKRLNLSILPQLEILETYSSDLKCYILQIYALLQKNIPIEDIFDSEYYPGNIYYFYQYFNYSSPNMDQVQLFMKILINDFSQGFMELSKFLLNYKSLNLVTYYKIQYISQCTLILQLLFDQYANKYKKLSYMKSKINKDIIAILALINYHYDTNTLIEQCNLLYPNSLIIYISENTNVVQCCDVLSERKLIIKLFGDLLFSYHDEFSLIQWRTIFQQIVQYICELEQQSNKKDEDDATTTGLLRHIQDNRLEDSIVWDEKKEFCQKLNQYYQTSNSQSFIASMLDENQQKIISKIILS